MGDRLAEGTGDWIAAGTLAGGALAGDCVVGEVLDTVAVLGPRGRDMRQTRLNTYNG